eukprot:TRINITY_DN1522_c0_g1_i1.p1 TRINITY_DN1522_c0_g1~~TRINITY_DN1522_c0_g1_i1.p1  ORF type:complete len:314 (+),score=37.82 TRINITY_DN1522_c0_g1_i1:112-1053(+)
MLMFCPSKSISKCCRPNISRARFLRVHCMTESMTKKKVLVSGASGQTGSIVFQKLLERRSDFEPVALVSTDKSKKNVQKKVPGNYDVFVCDVANDSMDKLNEAFKGCWGAVIVTSAKPQIKMFSLIPVLWAKFVKKERKMPEFKFKDSPEQVDWIGSKNQIDAAKAAGVQRVVFVSSMGVTDPKNTLNKIGNGNICLWKRKAEEYLMKTGLTYTILHPGGLKNEDGGKQEIVLDVDDKLLKREKKSIPRADVAEVCVQSLLLQSAENRAIDLISLPEGEGTATKDFEKLFSEMSENCSYEKLDDPVAAQILYQ